MHVGNTQVSKIDPETLPTLFGHPTGLYTLFFAEMWERFSFYGMRALLVLYMTKGFLGFGDKDATAVYGGYMALIYMTPLFGGMIADRMLGKRTAVVIGGLLMAMGHLLMMIQTELWFFSALGFLIAGNGFFKPNISSMVGEMYGESSTRRDSGFTIFYIGVNLGGAIAPLLCGYIGETYGWERGFGLATIGMLVGLAVFVAPNLVTQVLIAMTATASVVAMLRFNAGDVFSLISTYFVVFSLIISAIVAITALMRGGLPKGIGAAPYPELWSKNLAKVLFGIVIAIPVFVLLVSGFKVVPGVQDQVTLIPEAVIKPMQESQNKLVKGLAKFVEEASRPAGLVLALSGLIATIYLIREALRMSKIARERMFVVFILTFFSIWFWAFFEQQGSSINNFADRNVDRVSERRLAATSDVGSTIEMRLTAESQLMKLDYFSQEFLGHVNGSTKILPQIERAIRQVEAAKEESKRMKEEKLKATIEELQKEPKLTMTAITYLREFAKQKTASLDDKKVEWTFVEENVGKIGLGGSELPASVFQAVNSMFIILLGLVLTALWSFLGSFGMEPTAPVKFALSLIQVGLGFGMIYFGTLASDSDGMVGSYWLILFFLLLTTAELCLSPIGLSMVTKLSPARLVSTVMGSWFLATAFAHYLAGIIAQFASVNEGGGTIVPIPAATVHIYGDVYKLLAICSCVAGVICLAFSPLLIKWMHIGEIDPDA
ncbi:MAG: oligopeptide:H+ symporter [Planctomycetota bacterium]|nr:oligopeptide:H+ symporter [Planctomycetota bacterium]